MARRLDLSDSKEVARPRRSGSRGTTRDSVRTLHVGAPWVARVLGVDTPLSHVGADGRARMVDVGAKPVSARRAVAAGRVAMQPATLAAALAGQGPKGPVVEVARLAGVLAAKRTAELIPLCHTLPLDQVDVTILADGEDGLLITAEARTSARTGVEMEALTAVAVAGLTLIDMLKAVDRSLVLGEVRVLAKSGGRSGDWVRPGEPSP